VNSSANSGGSVKSNHAPLREGVWVDPGYTRPGSLIRNFFRLCWQLIRPPRGHRIAPTKTGVMLILVSLAIGTAAFNTAQNVLYVALALLLSSLVLSGLLSWFNFKGCQWQLSVPRHLRVGELDRVSVQVRNTKRWLPSYSFGFSMSAELAGKRELLVMHEALNPGEKRGLDWTFRPVARGLEHVALQGLISRYPFGFLQKTIRDSTKIAVPVWPKRIDYEWNPQAIREASRSQGKLMQNSAGVELLKIRDYTQGDAMRLIHWKASARAGRLLVKETRDEGGQNFIICLEPFAKLWKREAQFEKFCSFAASLAEDLFRRGQLRACKIEGFDPISMRGLTDLHVFMDRLARLEPFEPDKNFKDSSPNGIGEIIFRPSGGERVSSFFNGIKIGEA
jgi:hypothetical protein